MEGFERRLRLYLRMNEITQQMLAEWLGVTHSLVSQWCRGITRPRLEHFAEICETLQVSADYLLFGEEKCENHPATNAK